jgi:hypothetical protein
MDRDLDHRLETLAAAQHGLITRGQATGAGATRDAVRHRVRSRRWEQAGPGVYRVVGAPATPHQHLLTAVMIAGRDAYASHHAAAALHDIPGFAPGVVELSVPRGRRPRLHGVRVHQSNRLPSDHCDVVDAIPTTVVARTLFDLAATVHPRRVERALDNCLARRQVTLPAVWKVLDDLADHGRVGTAMMRGLLAVRGAGFVAPASELEARLLRVLRDAGLPPPAREIDVGDAHGWVGRVELVYREARVLIEADSRRHHSSALDFHSDRRRDNRLMAHGWRVMRFDWATVTRRPADVVALVRAALGATAA